MKLPQRGALYTEGVSSVRLLFEIIVPLFEDPEIIYFWVFHLERGVRSVATQICARHVRDDIPSVSEWCFVD